MKALDKKLLRDLWRMKGQALSIALVVASGVAVLVMSLSTYEALRITADAYYERYRFGHIFASVKRAPLQLERRIEALNGVQSVQLRISQEAILNVHGFAEPLIGRVVSVPEGAQPTLNQLLIKRGRLVEEGRPDEVVINESFALAHDLQLGDKITALINATERKLTIVGTAMSPEFIYVLAPFAIMPDKKRYGILWMGREAIEAAYDFNGAFNDMSLTLLRGTDPRQTVHALDALLAPYGNKGAIDRKDHLSNWFVQNELKQNQTSAKILPALFLLVAAFLTNTVLRRLIATESSEIGLMKAFGYSSSQVGWHYSKLVIVITFLGIVLGWVLGAVLGHISTDSYAENLNFPMLIYRPGPFAFALGACVSVAVALLATLRAVRFAVKLPPIVAMRPPAPPQFRRGMLALGGIEAALDQPSRIIFRQISRWPGRAALAVLGFAAAIAVMVLSLQFIDAVDEIARSHFNEIQRADLAVGFSDLKSTTVLTEMKRLPGVMAVEPMRIVPVDLSANHRTHHGTLHGITENARLTRIYDIGRGLVPVPGDGIVLNTRLAEKLGVRVGDSVTVHVLDGRRPQRELRVAAVYAAHIGMTAYINLAALNRLLGDRPVTQYVNLLTDENERASLLLALKQLPAIASVAIKSVAIENFQETIATALLIFVTFFCVFAFALGFGVTYNAQRIAFSERGRELATLRVLGFSRVEAFYILFGEALLLACVALPIGCFLGWGLTVLFVNAPGFQTELLRLPVAIEAATYGISVTALLGASIASGIAMKRRIDDLDLIAVLKTRE